MTFPDRFCEVAQRSFRRHLSPISSQPSSHAQPSFGSSNINVPKVCGQSIKRIGAAARKWQRSQVHLPDAGEPGQFFSGEHLPVHFGKSWAKLPFLSGQAEDCRDFDGCLAGLLVDLACVIVQKPGRRKPRIRVSVVFAAVYALPQIRFARRGAANARSRSKPLLTPM